MSELVVIDGSMGEGGGQVLRTSLALSIITGKPLRITNIRARRRKSGLLRQHLAALEAAAEVSRAAVTGAEIGGREVTFQPREVVPGDYRFSVGTAGSATLVFQTVLPALMTAGAPSCLILEGGTHNPLAPPFDFLEKSFLPLIGKMGPEVACTLDRPGFYPAGGGRFTVTVRPSPGLSRICLLARGEIRRQECRAIVARLPGTIGEREVKVVCDRLGWNMDNARIDSLEHSMGPGNILLIEFEFENVTEVITGFGMRGVRAEEVAERAVGEALRYMKAGVPVSVHLADQLLLPLAMAGGGSFRTLSPSLHTLTSIKVIESFLDVAIDCATVSEDVAEITVSSFEHRVS